MKSTIFALAVLGIITIHFAEAQSNADGVPPTFSRMASNAVDRVFNGLQSCGLDRYSAYDPRLPRPQVPADYAITDRRLRLLAYYHEEYFGLRPTYSFKNPNGGMVHSVSHTSEWVIFQTPQAGVVAQASRFWTTGGQHFRFQCRNMQTDTYQQFLQCLDQNWIGVITTQLCRFGTPLPSPQP